MIGDIRFHGILPNSEVEYFATVAGERLQTRVFHEEHPDGRVDIFLSGSRMSISPQGISHFGVGGGVSEYMFGSNMPIRDLAVKEVCNRLFLFGTFVDQTTESLEFSENLEGEEDFDSIFLEGHAASNTYFLVQQPGVKPTVKRQQAVLRKLGKFLKRSAFVGSGQDDLLLEEFLRELGEPDTLVLLVRVVNTNHRQFMDFYRDAYDRLRRGGRLDDELITNVANEIGVDGYQQERVRIDTVYKHEANKVILDEYKDILVDLANQELGPAERARLTRLRNLAVRNDVPLSLFDTLDDMLLQDREALLQKEPEYLQHTREIFQGLFLDSLGHHGATSNEEIAKLLVCKREAMAARDNTFEEILLETGRLLDEQAFEAEDFSALEQFSNIITYFDRFENAENILNQLAFMEDAEIEPGKIRSLLGNKQVFDQMDRAIFSDIIVKPLMENPYIIHYGRQKVASLVQGVSAIEQGDATYDQIADKILLLARDERLYSSIYDTAKEQIKSLYYDLNNKMDLDVLRREIEAELSKREGRDIHLPPAMFNQVVLDIRKESFYLNNLLPQIIRNVDSDLREDFLRNGGIDRFRVEELEREYFDHADLSTDLLVTIRAAQDEEAQ